MRSALFAAVFLGGLMAAVAQPSGAFGLSGVGFRGGFADPENLDGTLTIGGHMEFEERGTRLHIQPNLLYWNSGRVSDVNPNFDLYYHFGPSGDVSPYLGAGFGVHFVSIDLPQNASADETDAGLNLFGGVQFPGRTARFFIEGRAGLTEWDTTSITGGVTFMLGH
jgi:hypothetical protein